MVLVKVIVNKVSDPPLALLETAFALSDSDLSYQ